MGKWNTGTNAGHKSDLCVLKQNVKIKHVNNNPLKWKSTFCMQLWYVFKGTRVVIFILCHCLRQRGRVRKCQRTRRENPMACAFELLAKRRRCAATFAVVFIGSAARRQKQHRATRLGVHVWRFNVLEMQCEQALTTVSLFRLHIMSFGGKSCVKIAIFQNTLCFMA